MLCQTGFKMVHKPIGDLAVGLHYDCAVVRLLMIAFKAPA